jgi:hypothetical protein
LDDEVVDFFSIVKFFSFMMGCASWWLSVTRDVLMLSFRRNKVNKNVKEIKTNLNIGRI